MSKFAVVNIIRRTTNSGGAPKHLRQAVRRCSTDSGGDPKKSWNLGESIRRCKYNLAESYRRSTADMYEFFESDSTFYTVANFALAICAVTASVRLSYKKDM